MKEEPLTEKQRVLAAENHNLIYAYAHKNNILIDDYYDILAIGLCRAARSYDEKKGAFSTYVYRCLETELYNHWKSTKKKSVVPENLAVSYDSFKQYRDSDGQSSFLESIEDSQSYNDMMYDIMCEEFAKMLTPKEKEVFSYLVTGFIQSDIARKLRCTKQTVSYHVGQIREKAVGYLG